MDGLTVETWFALQKMPLWNWVGRLVFAGKTGSRCAMDCEMETSERFKTFNKRLFESIETSDNQ